MEYKDIFRHRGESYDLAMKKYPDARKEEFEQLFYKIPLTKNEIILDVPALGGYLKKYCLPDTNVLFLDFSQSINNIHVVSPYEKWNIQPVDRIVCLASIHHIQDLKGFLHNLSHHIKKDGILHIADVAKNNNISKFLDDFVGPNTSTKEHKGKYYNWEQVELPKTLKFINIEERNCYWNFNSIIEMVDFCRYLFDLQNVSNEDILNALNHYVGIHNNSIKWRLTYVDIIREHN